ncbi:MAG TPA: hypothetical protein VFG53_01015 [Anaeromyxobacter sp.]|nr:hypothetical protein [Anaeromyxobacter sp.]
MAKTPVALPKDDAEWKRLVEQMLDVVDDRSAVIIGATLVEVSLDELARSWLLPDAQPGFLGTYRAKEDLAYALGHVGDADLPLLDAISGIRNVFAHYLLGATFEHPRVREYLQALEAYSGPGEARQVFARAVMWLVPHLRLRRREYGVSRDAFRKAAQERNTAEWIIAARKVRGEPDNE